MGIIWGAERTMHYQLLVQGQAALTLSEMHADILPREIADEIASKATLEHVSSARIRELEEKTEHDIIALNMALEEVVSEAAKPHINKAKTSADTTQPARALQLKAALEVIIDSLENLRDITIERAVAWKEIPHMDTTHLIDALPTVAGRPFAFYAEMLQKGLDFLKFVYQNSLMGKWADATGNHHGATVLGIHGQKLEEAYCKNLGIGHMVASAQIPGLEFEAQIICALAGVAETVGNIGRYLRMHKGSDAHLFLDLNPKKKKGSAAMPHKDLRGGNPTAEEQAESMCRLMRGYASAALSNCEMDYGRDLTASANMRIILESGFKCLDHSVRQMAAAVYYLGIDEQRARERIERTFGITTSSRVLQYITDSRTTANPLPRSTAHDLLGVLATKAWNGKRDFSEVLLQNGEINSRIDETKIGELANPSTYIGESKRIITMIFLTYYQKKTLK